MSEDNSQTLALVLPVGVNPSSLYLLWLSLGGDVQLTAAAAHVRPEIISALEHDLCWRDLAGGRLKGGEVESEQRLNRVQNYVQSLRLRKLIDGAIAELEDPAKLRRTLIDLGAKGSPQISAKALVELAKAAEATHNLSYRALGDTVARNADVVSDETEKIKQLAIEVGRAATHAATLQATRTQGVVNDAIVVSTEGV